MKEQISSTSPYENKLHYGAKQISRYLLLGLNHIRVSQVGGSVSKIDMVAHQLQSNHYSKAAGLITLFQYERGFHLVRKGALTLYQRRRERNVRKQR